MGIRRHVALICTYSGPLSVAKECKGINQEKHSTSYISARLRQHSQTSTGRLWCHLGGRQAGRRSSGAEVQLTKQQVSHHCTAMVLSFGAN